MLREYWYIAAESRELGTRKPIGRELLGQRLVLWRDLRGVPHALEDNCIHRGIPLSAGEVDGDCVRCPFHGWAYNGEGRCTLIPSNGPDARVPQKARVRAYPVEEHGGYVWVYPGKLPAAERPPLRVPEELTDPGWAVGRRCDGVAANYTRVIEQSIDVAHVPWVHRKTIGKGLPRDGRIDRPMVAREDGMEIYFEDRMPDWLEAMRAPIERVALRSDGSGPPSHLAEGLYFDMPSLFRIAKGGIIAGLYPVPVNEGYTLIYHYVARRWLRKVPLLSWLFVRLNLQIIREDMRMLEVQLPKRMPEDINEEFKVRTDAAEIHYRRLREAYFERHPEERPRRTPARHEVEVPIPYFTRTEVGSHGD